MMKWIRRLGWLGCVALAQCGGATETAGFEVLTDAGSADAESAPDPACLALCASKNLWCTGVDTEAGTATITRTSAKGCSAKVTLVVSGTTDVTIDCTSKKVCVDQGGGSCVGTAGTCHEAEVAATSFSYSIAGCTQGSLACYVRD